MPLHRTSSGPALPQAISSMMHQAQSSPRNHHKHALRIVFALGVLLLLLSGWSSRSNQFDELENDHELEFYSPESLQEVQEITYDERMHLAMLHEGCMTHRDSVITSDFGHKEDKDSRIGRFQQDDPNLRMKLEDCPDVEVLLPIYLRGDGYCEDAMAYVKYLQGRALPEWVFDVKFIEEGKTLTYHDLCPKTSMIFLNHFWDGLLNQSSWPAIKPVYLMPNIEMYELEAHHYWRADVVLCKTAICARRVRMWYQQEGNPRHTRVLYTRHTTSDAALQAMQQFKVNGVLPAKNFSNLHFVHTAGNR
ncbi:hypothetical protein PsorP6_001000 [Peronosclerospora sorghi]|uniref:Uncharacterized protein n=1 Tax=Peronosclerospora sorghi TaxID=230839 RepID=A0ACC0WVW9_9STRA|nr:hypothetical protein PsorP6_001000 [Peronosclerospora sorghi]